MKLYNIDIHLCTGYNTIVCMVDLAEIERVGQGGDRQGMSRE